MQTSNLMKSYLRFLLAVLGIVAAAVLSNAWLANHFEEKTLPEQTGIFLKHRMVELLQNLPGLFNETEQWAFFWGASEIESGLTTDVVESVFRARSKSLRAVNVGMRNIHPFVYRQLTKRIHEQLQGQKRIKVSFVKIPLNKLTKRYARTSRLSSMVDQLSVVTNFTDIDFFKNEERIFASALGHHLFLADASTQVMSTLTERALRKSSSSAMENPLQTYFSIWSDRVFYESPAWNLTSRGTYQWNLPESKNKLSSRLQQKKSYQVKEASYKYFEDCCEIGTLNIESNLVDIFVDQVKLIKDISEVVILYTIPEEPAFESFKKPDYEVRRQDLLTKLSLATGLHVFDLDKKAALQEKDYMDFLHLSPEGQQKFYQLLFTEAAL